MDQNTPIRQVFEDRPGLNRLVRARQLDAGEDFVTALDAVHDAADRAVNYSMPTLNGVLKCLGDADYLSAALAVLERRDQAAERAIRDATATLPRNTTPDGTVRLAADADIGVLMHDPRERERRLRRARRLDGSYAGDDGAELFEVEDKRMLAADLDLVQTLEARALAQAAGTRAQLVTRELDAAIADAGRERHRLLELDAKFAEIEGPGMGSARQAARDKLREQGRETLREPLRLLDQLEARESDAEHDGLRQLDAEPDPDLARRFLRELAARRAPEPEPAAAVQLDQAPAGVHPESHALDAKIRERMAETGADYITALEQVMREGA